MGSMIEIRSGLATRLGTISGLRTSSTMPDQVNPPVAIVAPVGVDYDLNAGNGLTRYNFLITVLVARADGRSAQNQIDSYIAPTGATSIKAAIEGDRTLGGKAQTCRVTGVNNYALIDTLEIPFLSVDFVVEVYA